MGKHGPKGSPRLEKAAKRRINNPDLTNEEALHLAGYSKSQSALLSKRNALTHKRKLILENEENLTRAKKNMTAREKYHLKKDDKVPLLNVTSGSESKLSMYLSCAATKNKIKNQQRPQEVVQSSYSQAANEEVYRRQ
jgi:hypothetical protein